MEKQIEPSEQRHFPGTVGNPFDVLLHKVVELEKVSGIFFAALLFILAVLISSVKIPWALVLWAFFLGDWALLATLPRAGRSFGPAKPTVLVLAIVRSLFALLPVPGIALAAFQITGTLLVIYGFWIEPHRLGVTYQKLSTSKLPPGTKLRVLHLGDLHVERVTEREQKLNHLIRELQPDIILFSGDFLNLSYLHDPLAWEGARSIMKEWTAKLGVYAVSGSPAVDLPDVIPGLLQGLPMRWLQDEKVSIPVGQNRVDIVGISCTHKPFVDAPSLQSVVTRKPENFTILLYHSPDLAPEASALGIDLQLSGHTHGGQVRLPFYGALFAGSLYGKRFEMGRYQLDPMTLYVTRGIGLEGQAAPRVRFLCPPEIILWEIEGQ